MPRILRAIRILLPGLLLAPATLAAQSAQTGSGGQAGTAAAGPPSAPAMRISDAPLIDGVLDDAAWNGLQVLAPFTQRIPSDGQPASVQTDVRVGYDESALYVGIRAHDDRADEIVPGEGIRDTDLTNSDALVLIFDTYKDGVNGFVFGTNPAGVEYDGQVVDQGGGSGGFRGGGLGPGRQQGGSGDGFNVNWDARWEVATSRDASGWNAEFRIPFSTLRYRAGAAQDWGFNVLRRVRRLNEESYWSPVPRQFDLYRVSDAGSLSGLEPPTMRTVQVTPYALGSTSRNYTVENSSFDETQEFGADAKVQITQGLTLDLTYNTDFAQVEVDDIQTNLTRFSIQFPEKRPFFLENSGMFAVGGGGTDLFFSRRIGISRNGTRVPIQGGGRVSGKVAGFNVGLLQIMTDSVWGVQAGQSYSVARIARELGNRTQIGGAFMQRDGIDVADDANRTYAVDGQLGIGSEWNFNAMAARTETPGRDGRDHVVNLGGNYTTRSIRFNGGFREVGEDFNPEIGFANRTGYRDYNMMWMSWIRPASLWGVREFRPHARYSTIRDLETGFEETTQIHIDSHIEWHSGWFFSPALNWNREGLEEPFPISDGIVVPTGTYDGWEIAWHFYTNQGAPVTFETRLDWGDFLSGHRRGHAAILGFKHGSQFSTALRLEYNDVDLAQGSFQTRLAGVRFGYFFNPQIYVQSLVQYSDQTDNWSANLRFGWLSTAGTGLFVVYNQANGVDSLDGPLNRSLIIKYSRQFTVFGG
jgi:hypothetical protein